MSRHAAARQSTQSAQAGPPSVWVLTVHSPNQALVVNLDKAVFSVTGIQQDPDGLRTVIQGSTNTKIPFLGDYDSDRLISYSLTIESKTYNFYGVFSASGTGKMTGLISSTPSPTISNVPEDEGSWSAQARPTEDKDDRGRGKNGDKGGRR